MQNVLINLMEVIEQAKDVRDAAQFANPVFRRALQIVQEFLQDRGRICYGGMAINAHLPKDMKFYDFTKVLPDYDFLTPNSSADVKELVRRLKNAKIPAVEAKFGIHEGTVKVYANFLSVADITSVDQEFYSLLQKRAIVEDGVRFVDENFLRMSMYLELSRPMGQVERWDKVYKRLYLLNLAKPPVGHARCSKSVGLSSFERDTILGYFIQNDRIYASTNLERLYKHPSRPGSGWMSTLQGPMVAYSDSPFEDARALRKLLYTRPRIRIYQWQPSNEFIPLVVGLVDGQNVLCLIVKESACHAFNRVMVRRDASLRIASIDTLITLYYSLSYIRSIETLAKTEFDCIAARLTQLSMRVRQGQDFGQFPLFSLTCSGHQPSKESLLRAKKERVDRYKMTRKKKKD